MTYRTVFRTPFYEATSGGATAGVPDKYDVALAGRGYVVDNRVSQYTGSNNNWAIQTVAQTRAQSDTSKRPGEQTLSPDDLWRRSAETWHAGAGQVWYDRDFSDDGRFRSSKGIDPWTRGQLTLLPDTTQALTSSTTTNLAVVAGTYLYVLTGSTLRWTQDLVSWTTVTAASGTLSSPTSLASDGHNVWIVDGNDTYYTLRGSSSYSSWHSSAFPGQIVRYVKGRILIANGPALYNAPALASAAPASDFFTHPNTDWTWIDITEGPNAIYAAGKSGDKSLIYRTAVRSDGVKLDVPIVAGELPDGETVTALQGYLGFLMIGTSRGVRFAALDTNGNIATLGDLIQIGAVQCFEPQDRFVWFGWTDYDLSSTGLGRVDLRTFNGTAPAYASDLMADTQGDVLSVVTFLNKRVFTVSGHGCYVEADSHVAEGTMDSGLIAYGLADPKTAVKITTRHASGAGSYTVQIRTDDKQWSQVGQTVTTGATGGGGAVLQCPSHARGELFELRLTLTSVGSGPVLTRWTLRADVGSERRLQITVPLQLFRQVTARNNTVVSYDTAYEREVIRSLCASRQITTFQEGMVTYSVIVDDFQWLPYSQGKSPHNNWDGTLVVSLKTV